MKPKSVYMCQECGNQAAKWQGQCSVCGEWNSLVETSVPKTETSTAKEMITALGRKDKTVSVDSSAAHYAGQTGMAKLTDVLSAGQHVRFSSTDPELDRVLGGGLVEGSVILLGGEPGIGKSTLALSFAAALSHRKTVLYVSGEESLQQLALRAQRLQVSRESENLFILAETSLETVIEQLVHIRPQCLIIDSIQTMHCQQTSGAAGSVSQLRESTGLLVNLAKRLNICVLMIGHVTKQGQIAGPRILEHMVDTVLYFESDPASRYRFIRAVKNRFGAADELAVYAMLETGLKPVSNPSAIFMQQRNSRSPGSVCFATRQGTRQLLIEIQALVDTVPGSHTRRVAIGMDAQRMNMLLAVMHRRAGIECFSDDVYVNVVGGLDASETAADVPMLMAILSAKLEKAWPHGCSAFGEVGLSGEIRPVPYGLERLDEVIRQGFSQCILPVGNLPSKQQMKQYEGQIEIIPIEQLKDLVNLFNNSHS